MSTPADAVVEPGAASRPAVAPARHGRRFSRGVREAGLGDLLLLPAFLIFAVVFPLMCQVIADGPAFTGLRHFIFLIPPLAVRHWLRGVVRHRHAEPLGGAG